jgi:hypothetical protein
MRKLIDKGGEVFGFRENWGGMVFGLGKALNLMRKD